MVKTKVTNWDKLLEWRQREKDRYAQVLLGKPEHTTILKAIPRVGTVVVMGERRMGKSGLAHDIGEMNHVKHGMGVVLHLPTATKDERKAIKRLVPGYVQITTDRKQWPARSTVIYDESSQTAHARRTQSNDAVDLDNIIGISGQREQCIVFISHHSRKLDLNVITEADRIIWKKPTYAHYLFERDEIQDFVLKAFQFFQEIKTPHQQLVTSLVMNFKNFTFEQFKNGLPSYWSEELSRLFEKIKGTKQVKETE